MVKPERVSWEHVRRPDNDARGEWVGYSPTEPIGWPGRIHRAGGTVITGSSLPAVLSGHPSHLLVGAAGKDNGLSGKTIRQGAPRCMNPMIGWPAISSGSYSLPTL